MEGGRQWKVAPFRLDPSGWMLWRENQPVALPPRAAGDPLEMKTLVQQELIRRGILWSGIHNLCHAHGPAEIDYTLQAFAAVLSILKDAVAAKDIASRLQGGLLQPVFRKTSHFNSKPKPV